MTNERALIFLASFAAAAALALGPALAQKRSLSEHPGFVDGTSLSELVPDDLEGAEVVEINLAGPLLRALTPVLNNRDEDLGEVVNQLSGVTAVIASGLDEPTGRRARAFVSRLSARLQDEGWERLVRVREKGARTLVFVHYDGENADGLTVLSFEADAVTFVNIAGTIDLASLSELGERMKLPALGEAAEAVEGSP